MNRFLNILVSFERHDLEYPQHPTLGNTWVDLGWNPTSTSEGSIGKELKWEPTDCGSSDSQYLQPQLEYATENARMPRCKNVAAFTHKPHVCGTTTLVNDIVTHTTLQQYLRLRPQSFTTLPSPRWVGMLSKRTPPNPRTNQGRSHPSMLQSTS